MIRLRSSRLLAAAALLVSAAAPAVLGTPAHAAGCSSATGLTVVVDFAELGGGLTAGCAQVPDGSRAGAVLKAAGYSTTMATKSPGFVCRVNGAPASDPCVHAAPADAYWSVWWADGAGGSWVYSARGVDSLRVPDGGYVAMAWHQGSGRSQPPATVPVSRVSKPTPTSAPKPTTTPRTKPTGEASAKPSAKTEPVQPPTRTLTPTRQASPDAMSSAPTADVEASPAAAPSASPDAEAGGADVQGADVKKGATPAATPTPGETVSVDPELLPADQITAGPDTVSGVTEADSGLPTWVPVLLIAVVAAAGGLVVVRRRKAQA